MRSLLNPNLMTSIQFYGDPFLEGTSQVQRDADRIIGEQVTKRTTMTI